MDQNIIVNVKQLSKTFGKGHTAVTAVNGVDLKIKKGEMVLIAGPSGSGKTTLLSMIGALLRPTSGNVIVDGTSLKDHDEQGLSELRSAKIGFVFQAFNLLEPLSVEENILFPAQLLPGGMAAARERAEGLMQRLNLIPRRHALPRTLSGGEKQRVAIARALINKPKVILADEPTGNLDSQSGHEVMMILHDIAHEEGSAVLIVTHDPRVEDVADRILWLEDGRIRDRKREAHAWVTDLVCGMKVDSWTSPHAFTFGNEKYFFCSTDCLEKFKRAPETYTRMKEV
jgi:putative ABC transport system ATP-binding protein